MDLKGPFGTKPTPRGNRYVLVTIDLLTRAAELVPIPNKTAETVVNALVKEVFCRQGIPESFLTDRGCEFDNQGLATLAEELGIDKKRVSPLHPHSNGAVERLNRTVGEKLRKSATELGEDWDLQILFIGFNYMNHDHESTGYSPFYLAHGRHPRTPQLILASGTSKKPTSQHQWAKSLASRLKEAHAEAVTKDSRQKQERVDRSVKNEPMHKVSDMVMVHFPPKPGQSSKLQLTWQGPYIVVQCRQGNTYRVKRDDNFRKRILRHHDQLRLFHDRPAKLRSTESSADAPILVGPKSSSPAVKQPKPPKPTLTLAESDSESEVEDGPVQVNPQLRRGIRQRRPQSDLETGREAVTLMTMFNVLFIGFPLYPKGGGV